MVHRGRLTHRFIHTGPVEMFVVCGREAEGVQCTQASVSGVPKNHTIK